MKRLQALRISALLGCLLALGLVLPSSARDASKDLEFFPERNPVNVTDKNLDLDISGEDGAEKGMLWKQELGNTSYGGPTVAAGKVFIGTNNENPRDPKFKDDRGVLMCFDAKSGKFLWQATHEKLPGGEATDYPKQGVASTPVVEGDRVYYISNRCALVCADVNGDPKNPGQAKILWTVDMVKDYKVFPCQLATSCPLVIGDLVFAVTGNGKDVTADPWEFPNANAPSFLAADKRTGKVVWTDSSPGANVMEGQWTNPVFGRGAGNKPLVIFPGGDGWIYAFDALTPDKPVWKCNCNPSTARFDVKAKRNWDRNAFLATPVVVGSRLYIGLGRNPEHGPGVGRVLCIDTTKTGDVSPDDGEFEGKKPGAANSALVWQFGGRIIPKPARDRDVRIGLTLSTCCVVDDLVYIGEMDGYFHCLDAKTGEKYWTHDTRSEMWCSAYHVDGKVLIGNHDGDLYVFTPGKTFKEPKTIPFGRAIRNPPRVVDGILYVMTDTHLYAFGKK